MMVFEKLSGPGRGRIFLPEKPAATLLDLKPLGF